MKRIAVLCLMMLALVVVSAFNISHTSVSAKTEFACCSSCKPTTVPPTYEETSCEDWIFWGCETIEGVVQDIWWSPSCGTISRPAN
jgi:hypothetical protein